MKHGSLLYQTIFAVAIAFAANAHADPIVRTTSFDENIIIATDTFETTGGAILFSTNGVGYTDWLSPDIAADLAGDPLVPAQVQATALLVALASENQFLTEQGTNYIVLGGVGPAVPDSDGFVELPADVGNALAAVGGPGYSIVGSPVYSTVGQPTYQTGAVEPDGSIIDGTVNFDLIGESIVEQPAAATPEPSMLALLGVGLLISFFARRRAAGGIA
jgi:PEP-CTERM motif-containing protein